jgi:uncharacterized protein (TIGR03083 family)
VEITEHIDALRNEGQLLHAAAADAGLDTPVPSCPDWLVRDLVRHIGGIHRWARRIVAESLPEPPGGDLDQLVGSWPADDELLAWFDQGHAALVAALEQADPDLACWTFLAGPSPLAMWARRQAHETTIHRVDAELATGRGVTAIPAPFAADGVDELLACFITRPGGRLRADPDRLLQVTCADAAGDWLVRIGSGPVLTSTAPGHPDGAAASADCEVSGRAADLYLALWNRQSAEALTIGQDGSVLDLFTDRIRVRWS